MKSLASIAAFVAVLALAASAVHAQDPVVSDPTHYKLELENDHARVLHVTVEPNGKIELHELNGAIVVPLTDYQSTLKTPDGKSEIVERKTGKAAWLPGGRREFEAGAKGVDALLVEIKPVSPSK